MLQRQKMNENDETMNSKCRSICYQEVIEQIHDISTITTKLCNVKAFELAVSPKVVL